MSVRAARAALAALALTAGAVRAEIPPPEDDLSAAYRAAVADVRAGKDRGAVADRLKPAVEKHPASPYAHLARPFLADLLAAAKNPPPKPGDPPEKRLADSTAPFTTLKYAENWDGSFKSFVAEHPKDPAAELAAADRAVIGRLVPLLGDRTPTRCGGFDLYERATPQPRVCDVALALIEYHGKCQFHNDQIYGTYLHQLPDADREKVAKRVAEWWAEVKDKSVAAGVRAQLPHARSYPETVWMAKTLARLGEGKPTDDREFALNVLRKMVRDSRRNHVGAYAADALAELGDTSAVDLFYEDWKARLDTPGVRHDTQITLYLCRHGKRREWELLHAISVRELRAGDVGPGEGAVWSHAANSGEAATNPYAIPILGLALARTENTGSRGVESGVQSFSVADTACERLQKQVGKDFGYNRNGTAAERRAAIEKARAWWEAEGRAKYTFDSIEADLAKPAAADKSK